MQPILKLGSVVDSVVLKKWAARYRAYTRRRFAINSRGGGEWAPLKAATIRRRRKGRGVGVVAAILRDTGTLFTALTVKFQEKPGALEQILFFLGKKHGIRVGFGGPEKHLPRKGKMPKRTIAEIAHIHDQGLGNNPKRRIIHQPDEKTFAGMARDVEQRWKSMVKFV
jgi:hypothetical protein